MARQIRIPSKATCTMCRKAFFPRDKYHPSATCSKPCYRAMIESRAHGLAPKYASIQDTITTPKMVVEINGTVIQYKKKGPNGRILQVFQKKYTPHAVAGIHGRLIRGDHGRYLTRLVNRVELEQTAARLKMSLP